MRKRVLFLSVLLGVGLGLAQGFITIGSGSTTGVYFPVAVGLARLANDAHQGLRVNARPTGGSVFNVGAVGSGDLEMGLAQSDIAYYAYRGCCIPLYEGKPVQKIRALAALYPEVVHIVARAEAGIRSVADLKGKRVVVGDVGSGVEQNARQILEAYGLSFADLALAIRVGANQGVQLIQDGRADALFYTVGLGAGAIQRLALSTRIVLVPLDYDRAQVLVRKYPFYAPTVIPARAYNGVEVSAPSLAVSSILIANEDLSPDTVYRFMKAVFDNPEALKRLHPNLARFFDPRQAARGLPIPLHPGAERYWRERGLLR